jgi:salicylate hydroxylase
MRIAVAGAGIAGLTAAIALARRGFTVQLFESAARLEEVGAGIQLSPNAIRVLRELGVADPIEAYAIEPDGIVIFDGRSGRRLTEIPLGEMARRRYGAPYLVIHRADLQSCLLAAAQAEPNIALTLGRAVHEVEQSGEAVLFKAGGESGRADCLIAADGVHSHIRMEALGHPRPAAARHVAWRATVKGPPPPGIEASRTGLWLGPDAHLVHYPLRGGAEFNIVVVAPRHAAGDIPPLGCFAAPARALCAAAEEWRLWPLFTVDPDQAWTRGRVALIGDAAHAMLPTAAQGGAQAIEDAWVLARSLSAEERDITIALLRFETERRPRVRRICTEAARNLTIYGLTGAAAAARNIVISALPAKLHLARLDWIFSWSAK